MIVVGQLWTGLWTPAHRALLAPYLRRCSLRDGQQTLLSLCSRAADGARQLWSHFTDRTLPCTRPRPYPGAAQLWTDLTAELALPTTLGDFNGAIEGHRGSTTPGAMGLTNNMMKGWPPRWRDRCAPWTGILASARITDKHGVPNPMLRQGTDRACYSAQWGRGCFVLYH